MTHTYKHRSHAPVWVGLAALAVGATIAGVAGSFLHEVAGPVHGVERAQILGILLGSLVGIGGPIVALLWYTHRITGAVAHFRDAVIVGLLAGTAAVAASGPLEMIHVPGFFGTTQGSGITASFIEEALKLVVPVILLLVTVRFRGLMGFWTALIAGAWFGIVEGAGYVLSAVVEFLHKGGADTDIVLVLDVIVRAVSDIGHPLTTGGAAALIWWAASRLSRGKAVLVGIAAYLGASVLHALNDGVLGFYITNSLFSSVAVLGLTALVFAFWYRPQIIRFVGTTRIHAPAHASAADPAASPV